jgi:hypothetical protein
VVKGRIFYKLNDTTVLIKKDENGSFEKLLLKTAPAETATLLKSVM